MILERNVQLRQTNRPDYATNTSEFVRTLCAVTLMPPFKQTNIKLTNHLINDRLISKTTEVWQQIQSLSEQTCNLLGDFGYHHSSLHNQYKYFFPFTIFAFFPNKYSRLTTKYRSRGKTHAGNSRSNTDDDHATQPKNFTARAKNKL